MKTWDDLEKILSEKELRLLNLTAKLFDYDNESRRRVLFQQTIPKNPELINEYSHLLDGKILKIFLNAYPHLKLYLE